MIKGQEIRLVKSSDCHKIHSKRGQYITIGTHGKIISTRDIEGYRQYLVKFKGVGTPRHCEENEIVLILGERA